MNPLSSYSEKRFDGARRYSLFPDHLLVSGSETFRSDFEVKVPLANLHPEYSRAQVRNRLFGAGLFLAALCGVGVLQRLSSSAGISYEDFWSVLWIAGLVSGLILCAFTWRKTPYVIFVNESGQGIVGLIECQDTHFQAFVQILSDQIAASKRKEQQS